MRYKCLVLDHDDTVVKSTETIHYPCFLEYMERIRPRAANDYSLGFYLEKNFGIGIDEFFLKIIGLSQEELQRETEFWHSYVKSRIPAAFEGIGDLLASYRQSGGIIAVVSHSHSDYILRDWEKNGLPTPDAVYGCDMPVEKRKPSPYPILDIMNRFKLSTDDVLVVDDLKLGYDMARTAGVAFAAAGWAYDVPAIESFMKSNCDFYFKLVEELYQYLF